MSEHRSERVVTETDGGGPPLRPGPNPALIVGGILIALLVIGLVVFGMNSNSGDDDGGDGVRVTVPNDEDGGGDNGDADADVDADVDADADAGTDTTESP